MESWTIRGQLDSYLPSFKRTVTMKIGVTGHQRLDKPEAWSWVEQKIDEELAKLVPPFVGISSLAVGADQKFADLVLKHGGYLYVVLPFDNYEGVLEDGDHRQHYLELLERASTVETLPAQSTPGESYLAAGKRVVELSNVVLAVWNGKEAAGVGGTGDAVQYAVQLNKQVIHVNPVSFEVKILNT